MQTKIITEGRTKVLVPILDESDNYPPSSAPVFYNPKMELNRDISVACISSFSGEEELSYVDALAATGIMGLRVANEVEGLDVTINDRSRMAYETILENVKMAREGIKVHNEDANILLRRKRYDIIDIDPFGSPVPFLDSSSSSVEKLLCITATDTAPLCGAHKKAGIRRYSAVPLNTEYHKEVGVRILLGKIIRDLAAYDKSGRPLLSFSSRHFLRTYVSVGKGAIEADKSIKELGFILNCTNCGYRNSEKGLVIIGLKECPRCGFSLGLAGPLYLGKIHDRIFCVRVIKELEARKPGTWEKAINIVQLCSEEMDLPYYYEHHTICKRLKISAGPLDNLIFCLREGGFTATRTHFSGTSFKTDASIDVIEEIVGGCTHSSLQSHFR
ncbi:MAG: tRNA (guanine(10)-N(2))-dimethyltransferase [Halobacteriota archaeon]|nr:tRNA (guanine(10)-N(2))-dimethyltransferase [Halobacteriota archaeon]